MLRYLAPLAWLLLAAQAHAQTPQTVRICNGTQPNCPLVGSANPLPVTGSGGTQSGPIGKTTTQAKVTVSVTNTYQAALASSPTRVGCSLQYVAVAGTKGYVFFGTSPADTTTSFQLTNGQSINCAVGGVAVATDAINVTGTATDIFIVSAQ